MRSESSNRILIKPFIRGESANGRVIIRETGAPNYLCVSVVELVVIDEIVDQGLSVGTYLSQFLGDQGRLSFKEAVSLLTRLYLAEFIVDAAPELLDELERYSTNRVGFTTAWLVAFRNVIRRIQTIEIHSFEIRTVLPYVSALGRWTQSWIAIALLIAANGLLLSSAWKASAKAAFYLQNLTANPWLVLVWASAGWTIVSLLCNGWKFLGLAGLREKILDVRLQFEWMFCFSVQLSDDDAILLNRVENLRFHLSQILFPSLISGMVAFSTNEPILCVFAFAFLFKFWIELCPFFYGQLVHLFEGQLLILNLLGYAHSFIRRGILRNLLQPPQIVNGRQSSGLSAQAVLHAWLPFLAVLGLLWLSFSLIVSVDYLSEVFMKWIATAGGDDAWIHKLGAVFVLLLGSSVFVRALVEWFTSGDSEPYIGAVLPLRRNRDAIDRFIHESLSPAEVLTRFLRNIPVFNNLEDEKMLRLIDLSRAKNYRPGEFIIRQGESGEHFFIITAGRAQVIREQLEGIDEVIDILQPGDSFGELALIENTPRAVTIRASTRVRTLSIERKVFDQIFPPGDAQRTTLTNYLRKAKVVLESEIFSHLAPNQMRELISKSKTVNFCPGDKIVRRGEVGEFAYLIQEGRARVVSEKGEVAVLGPGQIIGSIALVKDIRRTADVIAISDLTALLFDKTTFLDVCMSNVFVALLIHDQSEKQMHKLHLVKKAG